MDVIRVSPHDSYQGVTPRKTKRLSNSSVQTNSSSATAASAQDALANLGFSEDIVKNLTLPRHKLNKPALELTVREQESSSSPSSQEDPQSPTPPSSQNSWDSNSVTSDLFQRSDVVAGSRTGKRLYPDVPVFSSVWSPREFQERFDFVVTELKRAVDDHPRLRDRARFINYWLCMCGTCPTEATPSIVVFCEKAVVGQLRDLFKRKAKDRLYCGKNSKVYQMFKDHNPPRPPFNLVYYRTDSEPLNRKSADMVLHPRLQPSGSFCGTLVKNGTASATLGVTLQIDNKIRAITVGHLFGDYDERPQGSSDGMLPSLAEESSTIAGETLNNDDIMTLNTFWNDDSDFASDEEDDEEDDDDGEEEEEEDNWDPTLIPPPADSPNLTDTSDDAVWLEIDDTTWLQVGKKDKTIATKAPYDANLDYAVIALKDDHSKLPNSFAPPERLGQLAPLETVASSLKDHRTRIYMISGASGIRDGTLLKGYAFVGANPGQKMCRTWMLILDDQTGVIDGDCGSVIVDQKTFEVYGHVIGSNPLNHAHVVPLMDTIDQIKTYTKAAHVDLPQVFIYPTKKLPEAPSQPAEPTKRNLKDRDHIFLIDDSASMRPHWKEAISLFRVLGNLAKALDGRNLEVHLPASEEVHRGTETGPLIKRMKEILVDGEDASRPLSRSDRSLKGLFTSHHASETTSIMSTGSTRPSTPIQHQEPGCKNALPHQQQHTTVYILTDGIWGQNTDIGLGLFNILKSLDNKSPHCSPSSSRSPSPALSNRNSVSSEVTAGRPSLNPHANTHIDIQFIHFGEAASVAEYVRNINIVRDRLAYPVAFETSSGNRLRMLLGTSLEQRSGRRCPGGGPAGGPLVRSGSELGSTRKLSKGDFSGERSGSIRKIRDELVERRSSFLKRKKSAERRARGVPAGKLQTGQALLSGQGAMWMSSGAKPLDCARAPVFGVA